MLYAAASALLAATAPLALAEQSVLRELRVNNNCPLPVILHEAGGETVPSGSSKTYSSGVDLAGHRVSLMFEGPYINENIVVVELNGLFSNGFGVPGRRYNVNLIAQWGFVDMPIEVAFWKDAARTQLACKDGRARCLYSAQDCAGFSDGSASYQERSFSGGSYGYCRSTPGSDLDDPTACVSEYAAYLNSKCEVFDRDAGTWTPQARSVGYSNMGWTQAVFADGHVAPSTLTGRENDGPAITFECWEAPCIITKEECQARGQTSVGNSGFAIDCDADASGLIDVAVLEVTACPSGGSSPTPAPVVTPPPAPAAPAAVAGLVKSVFGKCLDAPQPDAAGSKVHMWSCYSDHANQRWVYDSQTMQLRSERGLCVAALQPRANGGEVQLRPCDSSDAGQQWVHDRTSGQLRARDGNCLDAWQRSSDGGGVHLWACDAGNKNQQWSLGGELPAAVAGGHFRVQGGGCLDASQRGTNGGLVHLWACGAANWNQLWAYDEASGLVQSQYGSCLDSPQGAQPGGLVHIWACSEQNPNQQWRYDAEAQQLRLRSGICLAADAPDANGAAVRMQPCDASDPRQR